MPSRTTLTHIWTLVERSYKLAHDTRATVSLQFFKIPVCCGLMQVVCEKGLGVNGMTLKSLKEEGFKAVFIGIGELHMLSVLV